MSQITDSHSLLLMISLFVDNFGRCCFAVIVTVIFIFIFYSIHCNIYRVSRQDSG